MVALIKGSPYVAISAGQVSNHPCPCLKIERTNDVKADAGCSTLFRVSLSRQRRSGPVAMLELSRLFELAGGTRGMTDRPFDLERALPPLVSCPPAPFSLSLSIYLSHPSLSTPSRNSLENLSGGRCLYAAKINPKRAQKKIPRLYSPANRSSRSLALRSPLHLPIFLPSPRIDTRLSRLHNERPIRSFFAPFPSLGQHARYRASAMRLFEFSLRLNRFPIILCSPAVLLLDPSLPLPLFFLVKVLKHESQKKHLGLEYDTIK